MTVDEKMELIRRMKEEENYNQTKLCNQGNLVVKGPIHKERGDMDSNQEQNPVSTLRLRLFLSLLLLALFGIFMQTDVKIGNLDMKTVSEYLSSNMIELNELECVSK